MFRRLIATTPNWFALPVRLALGGIMFAHGAQKVLGSWGGQGIKAFVQNPAPYAFMRPSWLWMGAAAFSELVGGALVIIGLLTRLGALSIAIVMGVAIFGVHWGSFFASQKGIEYPVALFAMAFALLVSGGGQASIDLKLSHSRRR
jgi:putative oxidoreductase